MNTRERNFNNQKRDDRKIGSSEIDEVMMVYPHKAPFPGDKNFYVCDLLVKHRPYPVSEVGNDIVTHNRVLCLQRYHGRLQGEVWYPRVGDLVVTHWLSENMALILGTVASAEQEPVCLSTSDNQNYDYVNKRCKWIEPTKDQNGIDYVDFKDPQHPDCHKWWHKERNTIFIHDCVLGHDNPYCDDCRNPDQIVSGTFLKQLSDEYTGSLDKPRRTIYHHHTGSKFYFDEDGTVHLENRVSEDKRAHVTLSPDGTVEVHSSSNDNKGARIQLFGERSTVPGRVIIENLENYAHVAIYESGKIQLNRGQGVIEIDEYGNLSLKGPSITLDSNSIRIKGKNLDVDADSGSCSFVQG